MSVKEYKNQYISQILYTIQVMKLCSLFTPALVIEISTADSAAIKAAPGFR